jgi:multisubunit Na+/H+ antiporter MnhB subunit
MTDKQLLIVSIVGVILFTLLMRYLWNRSAGKTNEKPVKRNIRVISIIYGVVMTIQIIGIMSRLWFE